MVSGDPYVQFNPDNRVFWASHTGLPELDDQEVEAAYQRAYKYLTQCIKKLVNEHKWKEIEFGHRQILLSLSGAGYINRFSLPNTFSSFLNSAKFGDWRVQFETGVFEAKRPILFNRDIFISGPAALSDIFYLLQSIAPGMLIIADRIGEADDMGEMEWIRALPRETWVIEHAQLLKHVLGTTDAYQELLDASRDEERSFTVSWINQWSDDDESECRSTGSRIDDDYWDEPEFVLPPPKAAALPTTCGSECGGCDLCDH